VKVRDLQDAEGAQAAREALGAPDQGTAVLCSSSAKDPASMAGVGGITQFTDGLMQVLGAGSEAANDRLSLAQVHALVKAFLSARYKENAVAPELHAPDQRLGLPQDVPIFPNIGQRVTARVKPITKEMKRRIVEKLVSCFRVQDLEMLWLDNNLPVEHVAWNNSLYEVCVQALEISIAKNFLLEFIELVVRERQGRLDVKAFFDEVGETIGKSTTPPNSTGTH
jgi:hypothetical protein